LAARRVRQWGWRPDGPTRDSEVSGGCGRERSWHWRKRRAGDNTRIVRRAPAGYGGFGFGMGWSRSTAARWQRRMVSLSL